MPAIENRTPQRDRTRGSANSSTYDHQVNAAARREFMDWFITKQRAALVRNPRVRHRQLGLILVIEDGVITGCQKINTKTESAHTLTGD